MTTHLQLVVVVVVVIIIIIIIIIIITISGSKNVGLSDFVAPAKSYVSFPVLRSSAFAV